MRCLMFVCLLICSLPTLALDRSRVEGYLLPNGLQVILKNGYERDHVAIRLVVGVGLDDFDCEQKELPHLLEHLLFSGIDETGEGGLEERLQALGGEWNAYTSSADTTFVIEAPARNQRKVLDLLLAVIRDTTIDAKALTTAKRIIAVAAANQIVVGRNLIDGIKVQRRACNHHLGHPRAGWGGGVIGKA